MNKIEKFIENNGLDFTGYGSDLNSSCCIISGYALHLGLDIDELKEQMKEIDMSDTEELERVFEYAENNDYGSWWNTTEAMDEYKF